MTNQDCVVPALNTHLVAFFTENNTKAPPKLLVPLGGSKLGQVFVSNDDVTYDIIQTEIFPDVILNLHLKVRRTRRKETN